MGIRRKFREKLKYSLGKIEDQHDDFDNKDIFAFIVALYQLFTPLVLGLFITALIVTLIIIHLFR